MQLETFDLGTVGKEPGCIDASDGVAVARRGLKSVRGRVVLPDRDDNAVTATAPEQVSFEPLVGTEHRQRLLRGEALVLFGLCLIHLGRQIRMIIVLPCRAGWARSTQAPGGYWPGLGDSDVIIQWRASMAGSW